MIKKLSAGLVVFALLLTFLPAPAFAIGEAFTESSQTTANWCAANYPAVSLLPNSGLYCDLLTMRDSLQRMLAMLQQLIALRAQLQALLNNQPLSDTDLPPADPPTGGDTTNTTTNLRRVKIEAFTDKSGYELGGAVNITLRASKRDDGPSTVQFTNSCEAKYSLFKDGAATAAYTHTFGLPCAAAATTTYVLPKSWTVVHNQTAYPLAAGSYRLRGEVTGYNTADWYFNVKRPGAPTITMTSPTLNQQWATSSTKTITWSTTNTNAADLVDLLLMNNATNEQWSLGRVANDGSETVTVPALLPAGNYTLSLRVTAGGAIANSNSVQVVIPLPTSETTAAPFIQSVDPSSAVAGSSVVISGLNFTASGNQLVFGTSTLSSLNSVDGRITVNVPGLSTGLHNLRVTNTNGSSNTVSFTVVAPVVQPPPVASTIITVTAPNGGETLTIGATTNITWSFTPATGGATHVNVRVVHNDTNLVQDIAKNVPNTGSYSWVVGRLADGSVLAAGNKYRIRVCPVTVGDCDKSDGNVSLVTGATNTSSKVSETSSPQLAATAAVLNLLIEQLNGLLQRY